MRLVRTGRARWIHRREVPSLIGRRREQCFDGRRAPGIAILTIPGLAASSRHVVINISEAGSQSDS